MADRDGTMDMIVTSCPAGRDCHLLIAYNVQVPLCSNSPHRTPGPCRDPEALCVADPNFSFNFSTAKDNSVRAVRWFEIEIRTDSTCALGFDHYFGVRVDPRCYSNHELN